MSDKLNWGIISTAKIATKKVIPALQQSQYCEVRAIASRNEDTAREVARTLNIPKHYHSYEAMLKDPKIDVIYNPLPNHMHLEWTLKAIHAGKHVLCEKPLVLDTDEVRRLIKERDKFKVKVGEAFMVDTHPQWVDTARRIQNGELGKVKIIQGFFSYYNDDPANIRNIQSYGGGGLWDIGVYPIHTSRYVLGEEPIRVMALMERHPDYGTDMITSAILEFPSCHVSFHCSTLLVPYQVMSFFGDQKKLDIEIPFNAPNDQPCRVRINDGMPAWFSGHDEEIVEYPVCDQYGIQGDQFSLAILKDNEVPVPLENALYNTAIVNALFESASRQSWVEVKV